MVLEPELIVGLALSFTIGLVGYWRGALSASGILGAVITGTLMFGLGGWAWGFLLIAFFVSSSALSFYRAADKRPLAEKFAKDHRRDLGQALANGGAAALLAASSRLWANSSCWFFAAAGAMAAVNADTWATELGVLSPHPPRLITTGRQVEVGASGGVTWSGLAASLGGALFIGLLGGIELVAMGWTWQAGLRLTLAATMGGLVGAIFDSILGATVQVIYWCDTCQKETESRIHSCKTQTQRIRGWRWLGNDWVNFAASVAGALIAAASAKLLM